MATATSNSASTGHPIENPTGSRKGRLEPPPDWKRGFWSLIATQFQTGFNDNALKFLVTYLVIAMNLPQAQRDKLVPIVGAMFAVPFILFSMTGGFLADRYSKRTVTIGTKLFEIAVMAFFIVSLALGNLPLECAGVFLISTEGALFGPSKYGLLPELLPEPQLSWGNGIIEFGTFLAGIGGTVAAGYLAERYARRETIAGVLLLGFTCVGLATSFGISRVPAADPTRRFRWNPLGDFAAQMRIVVRDRTLAWAVLGYTYLFFLAALLQLVIIIYGHDTLGVDDTHITYLQAAVALGIGVGSVAAGYLSGGKIEYGLIPLGAVGMTVFGALLSFASHSVPIVALHLALLGFFGGMFAVPLGALIQHRPHPEEKGGVIAAANLVSFIGIGLASGAYYVFTDVLHQTPERIFLDGAILTFVTTAYSIYLLPDSLLRFVLWIATHTIYRLRVEGRENVPERGGALLVSNHLSFVGANLLFASIERPVRFLIYQGIYDLPQVNPFAKLMGAIPISSERRPREMLDALRAASDAIAQGELVCILAEGQITRIGQILPLPSALKRILKGLEAPLIPVNLDGVGGSLLSFDRGRWLGNEPRSIPEPVTISFGRPMPPTATPFEVRRAVETLESDRYGHRKKYLRTLGRSLIGTAHRAPFRFAMGDKRRPRMNWGSVLLSSVFLARRLRTTWAGQKMVGILLPPSVPGALVNFAAMLAGKVPVNLNYTTSDEALSSCAAECKLETVVTTKPLLDRIPLRVPAKTVLIEEVAAGSRLAERLAALLLWFFPGAWLERALSGGQTATLDDLATVIFSSGSTAHPQGVMLTHYSIASNIEQISQTFPFGRRDRLLGVLPFFHSFGFIITLCLPAVLGVAVVYHPSPLDASAISELVRDYSVTFLMATPTLLEAYLRRCSREDFVSLDFVLVGEERLSERLARAFEDRFGVKPLEGYGATECSALIAVNAEESRATGFPGVGRKRGRIGHPLPGIRIRIVDPDTLEPVPAGAPGLLLVRGPNLMQGYLGRPDETAEALRDGWYVTGDIATEEDDGSLRVTDRRGRFSKIGGEMVPHIEVEEQLHEIAGGTEQKFIVTAVSDGKKGERLVVLHLLEPNDLKAVLERLPQRGLPDLWLPHPNQFFKVDEFPHSGTGELDLLRIRALALDFSPPEKE